MSVNLPRHVAIIMDGNGRWAAARKLPRHAGHKAGISALRTCVQTCTARGIGALTVFAFSSENWARPAEEVSLLMACSLTRWTRKSMNCTATACACASSVIGNA